MDTKQALLRRLPAIGVLLEQDRIKELEGSHAHLIIAEAASEVVQEVRELILKDDKASAGAVDLETITGLVVKRVDDKERPSLRKVINATGIILHTNLGRAVLATEAVKAIAEVAGSYSNLELDLSTGERGTRYGHVEKLLCRLTGAEAGMVVNNNAAAVLLILSALAKGKEVIVSRGQLVEIGGSFRIPDVMTQSGAILKEVGTTNKTHLRDYEHAITDNTGLLLKVHTSNYRIIGFTSEVPVQDLVKLGREKGIPVFDDLGSGVLLDSSRVGPGHEPTVREAIMAEVDVVSCSGDKLFGGPQAGIILGRKELIAEIKKHPLTRALRVDKFTLAAMEATLRLYFDEGKARQEIPTLYMITRPREQLLAKAESLGGMIGDVLGARAAVEVVEGYSQVGGGALPEEDIPTYLISVRIVGMTVNRVEEKLRQQEPPVLARIQKDRLLFDPRTLFDGDAQVIVNHLKYIVEMG